MSRKDCGEAGCAEGCCGTAGCLPGARRSEPAPIDMVLHCPACGLQHIDAPDADNEQTVQPLGVDRWTNPPHRSHRCAGCGHVWRPADVPTNGVAALKTRGKNDSPIVAQAAPAPQAEPMTERDQFDLTRWHQRLGELADAYYEAGRANPARQRARAELMMHALDCATGWRARSAKVALPAPSGEPAEPVEFVHLPGTSGDSLEDAMEWAAQADALLTKRLVR